MYIIFIDSIGLFIESKCSLFLCLLFCYLFKKLLKNNSYNLYVIIN